MILSAASIMIIPASLAISKLRLPEDSQPLTAGKVTIPKDKQTNCKDRNAMITFLDGAWLE
jgi:CNT family concentrative nucleoside transporter